MTAMLAALHERIATPVAGFPNLTIRGEMAEKSPAFQFYPRDFLASAKVSLMDNAETGVYTRLLCFCWIDGSIPADLGDLARMLPRTTLAQLKRMWPRIGPCFEVNVADPTRLVQSRLDAEREKQAGFREKKSRAGSNGAEKRWQKDGDATALPPPGDSTAIVLPLANDSSSSSSSSLSSSATGVTSPPPAREDFPADLDPESPPAVRPARSPAQKLAVAVIEAVVQAGLAPRPIDIDLCIRPSLPAATELLASQSVEAIKARVPAWIKWHKSGKGRRSLDATGLLDTWTYGDIGQLVVSASKPDNRWSNYATAPTDESGILPV